MRRYKVARLLATYSRLHQLRRGRRRSIIYFLTAHRFVSSYASILCSPRPALGFQCLHSSYYYQFFITHSLFHSRLKTFFFCKSFPLQPFFFFFRTYYMIPKTITVTSSIGCFLLFSFSVSQFLVVVSVW